MAFVRAGILLNLGGEVLFGLLVEQTSCLSLELQEFWDSWWSRCLGTLGRVGALGRHGGGQHGEQGGLGCNGREGVLLAFGDGGILVE